MPAPSVHAFAIACGASGAYVDVSAYVVDDDTIERSWGKQSQFDDTAPGAFSFTLDNADGRFTPGNASSPLAIPLVEGMGVCWQVGTRLVSGTIRMFDPSFLTMLGPSARVRITVDDMLGNAGRKTQTELADDISAGAGQLAFWSMDGDENTVYAAEQTSTGMGALNISAAPTNNTNPIVLFGLPSVPGVPGAQVRIEGDTEINFLTTKVTRSTTIQYSQSSMGFWGFWVTPGATTIGEFDLTVSGLPGYMALRVTGTNATFTPGSGSTITYTPAGLSAWRKPHYLAFGATTTFGAGVWTITYTFYVDGVSVGTANYSSGGSITSLTNADRQPINVRFAAGDGINNGIVLTVSRLSHTTSLSREDLASAGSEAARLRALDAVVPEVTLDVLPPDLGQQQIGYAASSGTVLDSINDVMRTEQGYVWTVTSGSLLAPVEKVEVRARQRPSTVSVSFDCVADIDDQPELVRDTTNTISSLTVHGSDFDFTITDASMVPIVGSASRSETILNFWPSDLQAWGQDRVLRGKNTAIRVNSITVDAFTTTSDRWAELNGLNPGDRVRVSGLPSAQLGFATWDGWVIGGAESHGPDFHKFRLFLAPVLPQPALFDVALFAAGGMLSLASGITSGATSMSVAASDGLTQLATSYFPYTLQVDNEQLTVTNCTGSGPWTATITRGVNGTTAAAHSSGANVEIADVAATPLQINWYPNPVNMNPVSGLHAGAATFTAGGATGSFSIAAGWQVITSNPLPANSDFGYQFSSIPWVVAAGGTIPCSIDFISHTGSGTVKLALNARNAAGTIVASGSTSSSAASGTLSLSLIPTDVVATVQVVAYLENSTGSAFGAGSSVQFAHTMLGSGSFFYGGSTGAHWSGTVNNSPSVIGGKQSIATFAY